jgi:hypothetical protein
MTEVYDGVGADVVLPTLVVVPDSFAARLPSQRVLDQIARLEPTTPFAELVQSQPFRIVAFRALLRDFPDRDPTSLWLHAYDCEVQVETADPTSGSGPTPWPPSAVTGG